MCCVKTSPNPITYLLLPIVNALNHGCQSAVSTSTDYLKITNIRKLLPCHESCSLCQLSDECVQYMLGLALYKTKSLVMTFDTKRLL